MGRAIVREPAAFLMDEPLSNLDAKLRVQMRAEISGSSARWDDDDLRHARPGRGDDHGRPRRSHAQGELQQVDQPQRLYDSPVNLFVASFIGSPPMNLVEAPDRGAQRLARASFGDHELPIPDAPDRVARVWPATKGRRSLGIRPHNFEDAALASDAPTRLRGTVQITEALGSELVAYVSLRASAVQHEAVIEGAVYEAEEQVSVEEISVGTREGETTFCVSLDPSSRASEGETIELAVDTRKLHFFDLESGQTIA